MRTLGEFRKTNFELLVGNFEKIFEEFWTGYVEIFWTFSWNLVKISKNCWKNYGVNVGLILGKIWGNIGVLSYDWFCENYKKILKMFLWNLSEIVKKISRNVGNTLYNFFNILIEILWHFLVSFWRNLWKILQGFCFLQECSYHSVHHDCAKYPKMWLTRSYVYLVVKFLLTGAFFKLWNRALVATITVTVLVTRILTLTAIGVVLSAWLLKSTKNWNYFFQYGLATKFNRRI